MAFFKNRVAEWEKTMTENDLNQMEAQGLDEGRYREKLAVRRAKEPEGLSSFRRHRPSLLLGRADSGHTV